MESRLAFTLKLSVKISWTGLRGILDEAVTLQLGRAIHLVVTSVPRRHRQRVTDTCHPESDACLVHSL